MSEVDLVVAVEDYDKLIVGLLVEDQLLHKVRDQLARALDREAKFLSQIVYMIDATS